MKRTNSKAIILIIALIITAIAGSTYYFFDTNRRFEYNGQFYKAGENFMDTKGCNTCSFDKNGQMQCTIMA